MKNTILKFSLYLLGLSIYWVPVFLINMKDITRSLLFLFGIVYADIIEMSLDRLPEKNPKE